jgi:hypothetical protein
MRAARSDRVRPDILRQGEGVVPEQVIATNWEGDEYQRG